jgi:hypothetical protein
MLTPVIVALLTSSDALLLKPLKDAVTLVSPWARPIAKPLEFTVASLAFPTDQAADELTLPCVPSA